MSLKEVLAASMGELNKFKLFSSGVEVPNTADLSVLADVRLWLPTGIPPLDFALGGGLPEGRISEVFSNKESAGKTTLALAVAASTQRLGGVTVWLESEFSLDKTRAALMGVDLSKMILWGPPTLEDGFEFISSLVRKASQDEELQNVPILIVWDTLSAAPTRASRDEKQFGDGMMIKNRVISEALRKYTQDFYKHRVHLMIVSQTYTQTGGKTYVTTYETPGGRAIKFYCTTRIECRKIETLRERPSDDTSRPVGIITKIEAVKNKLALDRQPVECVLFGETGYDPILTMARTFLNAGKTDVLQQGGGWFTAAGLEKKVRGDKLRESVLQSPEVLERWVQASMSLFPLRSDRRYDSERRCVEKVDASKAGSS